VLDTNIMVSGLLSPYGPPGRLVDALLGRRLNIAYDDRILFEYRTALMRPRFAFDHQKLENFFNCFAFQLRVSPPTWAHRPSPDPDDTMFLECAAEAGVPLITGNTKHFPRGCRGSVEILSPAAFIERLR
jgi:uncharacterized protein